MNSFLGLPTSQHHQGTGVEGLGFGVSGGVEGLEFPAGVRIRGTLGDMDPLNKAPVKRATSRVQKGPLEGGSRSPSYYLGSW